MTMMNVFLALCVSIPLVLVLVLLPHEIFFSFRKEELLALFVEMCVVDRFVDCPAIFLFN